MVHAVHGGRGEHGIMPCTPCCVASAEAVVECDRVMSNLWTPNDERKCFTVRDLCDQQHVDVYLPRAYVVSSTVLRNALNAAHPAVWDVVKDGPPLDMGGLDAGGVYAVSENHTLMLALDVQPEMHQVHVQLLSASCLALVTRWSCVVWYQTCC